MLTGDKSTFAIECEMRAASGSFVYCSFRFWIGGEPIGNWDEEAVLGTLMYCSSVFLLDRSNRHLELADRMRTEALWNHVDRFANSDDPEDLRIGLEGRYRSRFLVHDLADDSVAKVCEVIVVERTDGIQRVLWKKRGCNSIEETTLPKLTIDRVLADFIHWAETAFPTAIKLR